MKKVVILSIVLFTISATKSYAQENQPQSKQKRDWAKSEGKENRDSIISALNLTKAQGEKIKALAAEGKSQREKIWSDTKLSDTEKKQKMLDLREDGRKKLAAILSKEQQDKLLQMKQKAKGKYARENKDETDLLLDSEY